MYDEKILQTYNKITKGGLRARWILARKLNGYKQEDIAREAGVTQSTVSGFEKGKNTNWKCFQYYYKLFGGANVEQQKTKDKDNQRNNENVGG